MDYGAPDASTRRPPDGLLSAQKLPCLRPLWTPWRISILYALLSAVFIPFGAVYRSMSRLEIIHQYDGEGAESADCKITSNKEGRQCQIQMTVEEDMAGPVFVYYQLENFYQNHQSYVSSFSQKQLLGSDSTYADETCLPLQFNGTQYLSPCGLIANTLFNDIFTIASEDVVLSEEGIAWESDEERKFQQPDGFVFVECDSGDCLACLDSEFSSTGDDYRNCELYSDRSGVDYAYWYPFNDDIQYLYESYPEVVSPIEGVKNPHFIVWMRVSGLPKFRKLYGVIDEGLQAGTSLTFNVTSNYLVSSFDGTKSLVVSTSGLLGVPNPYWGNSFLAAGLTFLSVAMSLAIFQFIRPNTLGDLKVLVESRST